MSGFQVKVSHGFDGLIASITARQKDIEFWTAAALTATAKDVERAEVATMAQVFDRPTRFTLNALYVKPASRGDLTAEVRFKEGFGSIPAWRYLGPQVEGGPRNAKSHELALRRRGILRSDEYVVPGQGVALDAGGNMKGGEITRILSDLGANPDPLSNSTKRSRGTKKGRARGRYFVLRDRKVAPGIYWRRSGRDIVPVMIFVRQPRYTKRFPFYDVAQRVVRERFSINFAAMQRKYPPKR